MCGLWHGCGLLHNCGLGTSCDDLVGPSDTLFVDEDGLAESAILLVLVIIDDAEGQMLQTGRV
jgi:hypothetical protein